jgi:hypothetical protein
MRGYRVKALHHRLPRGALGKTAYGGPGDRAMSAQPDRYTRAPLSFTRRST